MLRAATALAFLLSSIALAADDPIPLNKDERIVFLGDSITQGGGGAKGYVTLVTKAAAGKTQGPRRPDLQCRNQRQ
ncbi:MAG: hypothetical protein U0744_18965 [Gemmataceae bacterium]